MDYWYEDEQTRTTLQSLGGSSIKEIFGSFLSPRIFMGEIGLKFFGLAASISCESESCFIVADDAVVRHAKEVSKVLEENAFETTIWTGVKPEPSLEVIEECGKEMRENEPDLIVGVS